MFSTFYFSQNNHDISIATHAEANQILYLLKDVALWLKENDIDQS